MRLSPFTPVLWLLCFGYHLPVQNGRTGNEATYVTVPFVCRADDPRLWLSYQAIQLSSSYADFHSHVQRALGDFIYRCTPAGVIRQQHAALPIRFPHPDKLWNDRLFSFSPSFLDIFAYRLLKAVFNTHPYGRTIFSLMCGFPVASAFISAYESAVSSTSSQERTGLLLVMICEMNFCLFSIVCYM